MCNSEKTDFIRIPKKVVKSKRQIYSAPSRMSMERKKL